MVILKPTVIIAVIDYPEIRWRVLIEIQGGVVYPGPLVAFLHIRNGAVDLPALVQRIDPGKQENMRIRFADVQWPYARIQGAGVDELILDADAIVVVGNALLGYRERCQREQRSNNCGSKRHLPSKILLYMCI